MYRKSWKEINELKNNDQKYYSNYDDVELNKYKFKTKRSLRFRKNKVWINKIDPYRWFQCHFGYFLGRRPSDDFKQINRWKRVLSRFNGKLIKVIKDSGGGFGDYSMSSKI